MRNLFVFVLFIAGFFKASECQISEKQSLVISLQYIGLTIHLNGGTLPQRYPLKLDSKAYFVVDAGASSSLDYRFHRKFFLRFSAAVYKDCAFVSAGYFHIGPRGLIASWGNNEINGGLGPTLVYRQDWHRFPEFKGDAFYGNRTYHGWQYRFFLFGGEFEYIKRITKRLWFQYSLIPGAPLLITSRIGCMYRL